MTAKKVFDFTDYKAFLKHIEEVRAPIQRGFRSRLAEETGCQNAFISQVLNSGAQFSLEQTLKIASYLKLTDDERHYFLWLVEYARAGSQELKTYFQNLMTILREKNLEIKERVGSAQTLSIENQSIYYSHWYYAAIHVLVTIPKFRTVSNIAQALDLPAGLAERAVLFLVTSGLLTESRGELRPGPTQLHLDRGSPNISKHHTNWRIAAINSLSTEASTDVHYSTVSSLSLKDIEAIRSQLVQQIQTYVETVQKSPEEELYCFSLDFFGLIRRK
jgi:uncharacterized protein (TIGR02147 family)